MIILPVSFESVHLFFNNSGVHVNFLSSYITTLSVGSSSTLNFILVKTDRRTSVDTSPGNGSVFGDTGNAACILLGYLCLNSIRCLIIRSIPALISLSRVYKYPFFTTIKGFDMMCPDDRSPGQSNFASNSPFGFRTQPL